MTECILCCPQVSLDPFPSAHLLMQISALHWESKSIPIIFHLKFSKFSMTPYLKHKMK